MFTKIVRGEIPCYLIAEDERHFAFLDINPLAKGHTLVIPKQETDCIFDLSTEDTGELHKFARKVAKAIDQVIPCKRVGMAVVGLEVPHAHIHLIPINDVNDINFARPKLELESEEFEAIAEAINKVYNSASKN